VISLFSAFGSSFPDKSTAVFSFVPFNPLQNSMVYAWFQLFSPEVQMKAVLPLKFTEFVHALSRRKRETVVGQLFSNLKYFEFVKKKPNNNI